MDEALTAALEERRAQSLYRSRRVSEGPQGAILNIDGRELINFCSNDYLGLANHPEVISAFKQGAEKYGVGSGASHLINGHSSAHHVLEEELADFVGRPRALLFSTGIIPH
jgi:8-amino-7-oxononanoate synthase